MGAKCFCHFLIVEIMEFLIPYNVLFMYIIKAAEKIEVLPMAGMP